MFSLPPRDKTHSGGIDRVVGKELSELIRIRDQSRLRAFAVQEDDKQKIIDISDNVEKARKCLMVRDRELKTRRQR